MTRLLLVEDDPTSQGFLRAAARALPAEVDVAASVADALALAVRNPYDAWLIDAHLPDGTGAALLDRLRAEGLKAPALAHTAAHERSALSGLRAAGFARAVSKPVSAAAWQAAIRGVLTARRAPAPPVPPPWSGTEPPAVWDRAAALAAIGGDARNAEALRALFLAELPATRDAIVRAAAGDLPAMRDALHRLRASCGFVGAQRLGAAVVALETAPDAPDRLQAFAESVDTTLAQR